MFIYEVLLTCLEALLSNLVQTWSVLAFNARLLRLSPGRL